MNEKFQPRVDHDVTILLPTLARESLRECLTSIAAGSIWPKEVLLIDQGVPGEVEKLTTHNTCQGLILRKIESKTKGIPAAMNLGLQKVTTNFVAITHDDCQVFPDWLENLTSHLHQIDKAIVTGRVTATPSENNDLMSISTRTSNQPREYHRPLLGREILFPGNMGFSMAVSHVVGPFDENPLFQLAGEDVDWSHRALKAGVPILFRPDVAVSHCDYRDRNERQMVYQRYARAQGAFYAKYLKQGDLRVALRACLHLLSGPWKWGRGVVQQNWDLRAKGRAVCWNLVPGIIAGWYQKGAK